MPSLGHRRVGPMEQPARGTGRQIHAAMAMRCAEGIVPVSRVKGEALTEVLHVRYVAQVERVADLVAVHGGSHVLGVDQKLTSDRGVRGLGITQAIRTGGNERDVHRSVTFV